MRSCTRWLAGLGALLVSCGGATAQLAARSDPPRPTGSNLAACTEECADACCPKRADAQGTPCDRECLHACCVDLSSLIPGFRTPSLTVGDPAPALALAEFYRGEPVTKLEPGRVYVVEFWATWCKPCIDAFPHLSELQAEHADDLTVIGVNIMEQRPGEPLQSALARLPSFVEAQGDRMSYTVAREQPGRMVGGWNQAAGRSSIPSAFIVDRDGTIAWIGNPHLGMDEALEAILGGTYSRETAKKDALYQAIAPQAFRLIMQWITSPDAQQADKAYRLAGAMAAQVLGDKPDVLQALARIAMEHPQVKHRDLGFALELSRRAAEATSWENPVILDTYARARYVNGDAAGAVETLERVLAMVEDEPSRKTLQRRIDEYRQAAPLAPAPKD